MSLATRCPACHTLFRITTDQLRQHRGLVRCGRCQQVFEGEAYLHPPSSGGRSTTQHSTADTSKKLPDSSNSSSPSTASASKWAAQDSTPAFMRQPASPRQPRRQYWGLYASLLVALLLITWLQVVYLASPLVSTRWPALAPAASLTCQWLHCPPRPLRKIEDVAIAYSELRLAAEGEPHYVLQLLLQNRGAVAVTLPAIELVIEDDQEQVITRRVLLPDHYLHASRKSLLQNGLAAQADLPLRLQLTTPRTAVSYRLLAFYP